MKNNNLRKICIPLFVSTCVVHPAMAGEDDIDPQDLGRLIAGPASVVVAVESAGVYLTPDASTAPVSHLQWTFILDVDSKKMAAAPTGWIPLAAGNKLTYGPTLAKQTLIPSAWIRRRDVALPQDFKKIVGCWPVKSVTYVGGDYGEDFKFWPDGGATVKEWGDDDSVDKLPPFKVHLFIAKNLVIAHSKKAYYALGYQASDRTAFPEGTTGKKLVRFSDSVLEGCESGLRLAPENVTIQ